MSTSTTIGVGKTVVDRERYFASPPDTESVTRPAVAMQNGDAPSTASETRVVTETTVVNAAELSEARAELSTLRSLAKDVQNVQQQQSLTDNDLYWYMIL